jgi:hypothetical protein
VVNNIGSNICHSCGCSHHERSLEPAPKKGGGYLYRDILVLSFKLITKPSDISTIDRICKFWRQANNDESVWKSRCVAWFANIPKSIDPKQAFLDNYKKYQKLDQFIRDANGTDRAKHEASQSVDSKSIQKSLSKGKQPKVKMTGGVLSLKEKDRVSFFRCDGKTIGSIELMSERNVETDGRGDKIYFHRNSAFIGLSAESSQKSCTHIYDVPQFKKEMNLKYKLENFSFLANNKDEDLLVWNKENNKLIVINVQDSNQLGEFPLSSLPEFQTKQDAEKILGKSKCYLSRTGILIKNSQMNKSFLWIRDTKQNLHQIVVPVLDANCALLNHGVYYYDSINQNLVFIPLEKSLCHSSTSAAITSLVKLPQQEIKCLEMNSNEQMSAIDFKLSCNDSEMKFLIIPDNNDQDNAIGCKLIISHGDSEIFASHLMTEHSDYIEISNLINPSSSVKLALGMTKPIRKFCSNKEKAWYSQSDGNIVKALWRLKSDSGNVELELTDYFSLDA